MPFPNSTGRPSSGALQPEEVLSCTLANSRRPDKLSKHTMAKRFLESTCRPCGRLCDAETLMSLRDMEVSSRESESQTHRRLTTGTRTKFSLGPR